jgi:NAD(P)H dehydrogenase (quinone)
MDVERKSMLSVVVVYHSAYGHNERLAQSVWEGVARVEGVEAILIAVEYIEAHWTTLAKASAIIWGSPTYMGSVSGVFKQFMDKTGTIWSQRAWKDKLSAAFTCSACLFGDKMTTLQQLHTFAMQHGMIWVGLDALPEQINTQGIKLNQVGSTIGVMAVAANEFSAEQAPNVEDYATAAYLGERVARLACAWIACSP